MILILSIIKVFTSASIVFRLIAYHYFQSEDVYQFNKFIEPSTNFVEPKDSRPHLTPEEEEIGLDPFKYLPPESELKAAEQQQRKLMEFIRKEKAYIQTMTGIIRQDIASDKGSNCQLPAKDPLLSANCAHIVSSFAISLKDLLRLILIKSTILPIY